MLAVLAFSLLAQAQTPAPPLVVEVRRLPQTSAAVVNVEQVKAGQASFTVRCAMCHGKDGNADTPMGKAMKPAPARFSDPIWQSSTSDEAIRSIVTLGGAALKRSAAMPAAKDLKPGELDSLLAFVRSLKSTVGWARVTVRPANGPAVVVTGVADSTGTARISVSGTTGTVTVDVVDSAGRTSSQVFTPVDGAVLGLY